MAISLFDLGNSATFSPCGKFRYTLTREWGGGGPRLLYILLNPSTADAERDDPTVARCVRYARGHYSAARVCNIFAFRATDPKMMKIAYDPVGPDNDEAIRASVRWAYGDDLLVPSDKPRRTLSRLVLGWGNHGKHRKRHDEVLRLLWEMLTPAFGDSGDFDCRAGIDCFGINRNGTPKHPLYTRMLRRGLPVGFWKRSIEAE